MKVILGSSSPRREKILQELLGPLAIVKPHINEIHMPGELPEDFAMRLSREKYDAVISQVSPTAEGLCVITADTIVAVEDKILGKPKTIHDALETHKLLRGRSHRVITAVTTGFVSLEKKERALTDCETSIVTFKELSEDSILQYLHRIEYRDKAGGYAFQEHGDMIIKSHSGSVSNIIGFPLGLFFRMAADLGIAGDILTL